MAYFGSIIKNLPKEFVDVHVGSLDGKISDFSALAAEYRKQIDQFAAEGYSVLPLNPDMLDNYRAAAMSTEFYGPATKLFDWGKTRQTRLAALVHSTYLPLDSNGFSANYYLLASRREAEHKELLKVLPAKNPRLFRKISALSRRMLNTHGQAHTILGNGLKSVLLTKASCAPNLKKSCSGIWILPNPWWLFLKAGSIIRI